MKANARVFDKYADASILAKIVDYVCVTDMWEHSVNEYAENDAVVMADKKVTYGELNVEIAKFRTILVNNGIKQGDKVGVYIPNSIEFVKAYLAITTMGAVAVLLPPHLDSMTVMGCSMKFGMSAIVYHEALKANTEIVAAKNPSVKLIKSDDTADCETASTAVDAKAPCTIIFTGGTTGKSKGSLLSNGAVMRGTKNGCYGYPDVFGQRYLLVLPLTHVFGLIRNMLTSLYTGSTLFICANNQDMFRDIAVFKPTIIVLVPALAEMALKLSKKFGKNMLGESLKTIICGAAFVPPYLIKEYDQLGISLFPGYGLTESANLVSGNAEAKGKPDSVGYIYADMEVKIVDGELWLKGPNMQDCYYGEEEENRLAYEDGWFKTGDLAKIDDEGLLYITGRKKEIIVLPTGENVSPAELEAKFVTIDAIQDCLVFENDNGKLELEVFIRDTVVAAQNIADPQQHIKDRVAEINATLPTFEKITNVRFRDVDFVRSPSMKIVRSKNGNVKG